MTFKPKFADYKFTKISVDNFIEKYKMDNPKEDLNHPNPLLAERESNP
jgi:hypothetical protein